MAICPTNEKAVISDHAIILYMSQVAPWVGDSSLKVQIMVFVSRSPGYIVHVLIGASMSLQNRP